MSKNTDLVCLSCYVFAVNVDEGYGECPVCGEQVHESHVYDDRDEWTGIVGASGGWGAVAIDSDADDPETYRAWVSSVGWNGWAVPFFPLATARAVLADHQRALGAEGRVWMPSGDASDSAIVATIVKNGETLYGVGAGGWVWVSVPDAQDICASCGEIVPLVNLVEITRVGVDPTRVSVCADCVVMQGGAE